MKAGRSIKRMAAGLAGALLLTGAAQGDFLVLPNGESYRGKLSRNKKGQLTTSKCPYIFDPSEVAWSGAATNVDQVIKLWGGSLADKEDRKSAVSCLSLGKFCLQNRKPDRAFEFISRWGRSNGFMTSKTRYYIVVSNSKKARLKEIVKRLDAAQKRFQQDFKPDRKPGLDYLVRMFRTEAEFDAYCAKNGVSGAGAYYDPDQRELVLCDMSMINKNWTFQSVYHEANHQFMCECHFRHQLKHAWFSEGFAVYYETAKYKAGNLQKVGKRNMEYLLELREGIKLGRLVPLRTLLKWTDREFYGQDPYHLNYPQAWGLVYFFLKTKDKEYRKAFKDYMTILKKTRDGDKALAATIGKLDLDAFEKKWHKFLVTCR